MLKFFYKNEILIVFSIIVIIFCQLFFKKYTNVLDDFEKNKNYVVSTIQSLKYEDSHILRYIKEYAIEYLDKVAPVEDDINNLIVPIGNNEYKAAHDNELNGEFYGYFEEDKLEQYHSEIDFTLSLNSKFKEFTTEHTNIENIYYNSINGFEYKWPKSSSSSLNQKYNYEETVFGEESISTAKKNTSDLVNVNIDVFDKSNRYYGIVGYKYYPSVVYSFLDDNYPCIIKDADNNIIYMNIDEEVITEEDIVTIDTVFIAFKQAQNNGEILVYQNKYYYLYAFADGTMVLQYLQVGDVLYSALYATVPILLVAISYSIFLIFKTNYEKSTDEFNNAIEDLDKSYKELRKIANTDFLTKLNNRSGFSSEIEICIREHEDIFFVMADIDKFKGVNDTYGHEVGDIVLKDFADVLKKSVGKSDLVARWGGEEFVIAFTDITEDEALSKTEQIRKDIMKLEIDTGEQGILKISASFGLTKHRGDDFMLSLNDADEALYYSKNTGRNKVTKYSDL